MIDVVLNFLKNHLNNHFNVLSGEALDDVMEERVTFIDAENIDPISFKREAVTVMLINVEEEKILRRADVHTTVNPDGSRARVNPEIRLNLYVLFIASFKQYERALNYLSEILKYFQANRVFDRQKAPELNGEVGQLALELITQPFSQQNEIWNALRTTYQPSLLYKVKMLVYADENAVEIPAIGETNIAVEHSMPAGDRDN